MDQREDRSRARDIVVIGASAGGIEPLTTVVRELPGDLPAAVLVVVHTPPNSVSRLPNILGRAGPLPAAHAVDGEPIVPGRIYVAPPDHHLLVRRGRVEVSRGPRENHARPAIDPLFRTAAREYGPHAIGVILSGALYDGAAGLLAIRQRGGIAIVQDTNEAMVPSMPLRALETVDANMVLGAAEIGGAIARSLGTVADPPEGIRMMDGEERLQAAISDDFAQLAQDDRAGQVTMYTCPDCGGTLWQSDGGTASWFQCHVGHSYAPEVLLGLKSEEVEAALWTCIRLLREKVTLSRQAMVRYAERGNTDLAARAEEQVQVDERSADALRRLLDAVPSVSDVALPGFPGNGPDTPGAPRA